MSNTATAYIPLTTGFTVPNDCWTTPWVHVIGSVTAWKQGGDGVALSTCFPPFFATESHVVYSPALCPVHMTSACDRVVTSSDQTQTIVSCCPVLGSTGQATFACASSTSQHPWESDWGCASSFSPPWALSSGSSYVLSMYQLHVMVVHATGHSQTTGSAAPFPSSSSSASLPASATSSPTASSANAPAASSNSELSKGAIAGIAIGAVVGVAVISILAFVLCKLYRKLEAKDAAQPDATTSMAGYKHFPRGEYDAQQGLEVLVEATPGFNEEPRELDGQERLRVFELRGS
ncbi:hypothetical protein K491DRAFT_756567 [Lophiostoma macrostomum CBS 122681]|uniref:Mid2 domain-containing protein n=1 Tax=Lophiostoma macrostomum CBS 122681 TaxID=1314788 RepID=A0A6A6TCS2_9PLEO|nr:hypothetical protein K491DRAFT_756567 [Lophiostoma macrostomum CBS 122681]